MQLNRLKAAEDRVQTTLAKAKALYGVDLNPTVRIDIKGRVAGWAKCRFCRQTSTREYTLRLNRDLVLGDQHHQDMLDETIPHEVAHLVCYARPALGRKHDNGWKTVCIALGGNGNTRHSYEVEYAAGGYRYRSTCGTEIVVSKIIHERIQNGSARVLKRTRGRITRDCAWAPDGQPLVVHNRSTDRIAIKTNDPRVAAAFAPPRVPVDWTADRVKAALQTVLTGKSAKPVAATPPNPVLAGKTKAEVVRGMIRLAILNGRGQAYVIQQAQDQLGMARSMATKYVTENWSKA